MWKVQYLLIVFAISFCRGDNCEDDQFSCARTTQCINGNYQCDGMADCFDGTDECNCEEFRCPENRIHCDDGTCSLVDGVKCDGYPDCILDGTDEKECDSCEGDNLYHCVDEKKCIYGSELLHRCDGHPDCSDDITTASDEKDCASYCADNSKEFCRVDNYCIPEAWKCDGVADCSDHADETGCTADDCSKNSNFYCAEDEKCIPDWYKCDQEKDCTDGEDEKDCPEGRTVNKNKPKLRTTKNGQRMQSLIEKNKNEYKRLMLQKQTEKVAHRRNTLRVKKTGTREQKPENKIDEGHAIRDALDRIRSSEHLRANGDSSINQRLKKKGNDWGYSRSFKR